MAALRQLPCAQSRLGPGTTAAEAKLSPQWRTGLPAGGIAPAHALSISRTSSTRVAAPSPVSSRHRRRRPSTRAQSAPSAEQEPAVANPLEGRAPQAVTVAVVGSTGYIGKFVTKELVSRGFNVLAVTREKSGIGGKKSLEDTRQELEGAEVVPADVTDLASLKRALEGRKVDAVVSCLASRTGGIKDSWLIDYTATRNSLEAGQMAGAQHFVLLSAICVQRPLLEFQRAKLKLESELEAWPGVTHSIVRPTAFFKSLGGQVESVRSGGPYVMFGDGKLCACKPISEADLASYIADCVTDSSLTNRVLPIGGPGAALTPEQQGQMLFDILGKEPKFLRVPVGVMDFAIGLLDALARVFQSLEDAAEFAKIGKYYATESMLVWDEGRGEYDADATPSYGRDTLKGFFEKVAEEGMAGQELGDQAVFK